VLIVRYDGMRGTSDRCRQNVSVLRVVRHYGNQVLIIGYQRLRKTFAHNPDTPVGLCLSKPEPPSKRSMQFGQDMIRPAREIKTGLLRESQESICNWHWGQDAGI
jgi:hypothetical protein